MCYQPFPQSEENILENPTLKKVSSDGIKWRNKTTIIKIEN